MPEMTIARAVGVSNKDKWIVVGMKDGTVWVIDLKKWKMKKIFKHAKEWISDIKFSPDDKICAIRLNIL